MEIIINQQKQSVPENYSLEQLLLSYMPNATNGIAVAINQQVIPKSSWQTQKLQANDNIMVIKATPGG